MNAIRLAQPADIPRLMRLLTQVNLVHVKARPDLFFGPAAKFDQAELAALLRDGRSRVFVSVNGRDEVEGHCFCRVCDMPASRIRKAVKTLRIEDLCVEETARGKGLGRALYAHALAFARAQGCYNVTLNVWAANRGAAAFYRRLGMREQKVEMEHIL